MTATSLANSPAAYGSVAKTFHWLTALLILTAIPLGVIANDWPFDSSEALATKALLFSLHKTVGVSAFFVALARILWALSQPKPALPHPERRLESALAETVHWALYAALVLVPLSGWLHHAATSGFAPILWPFGQALPLVPQSDAVAEFFAGWHEVFTKVLIAALLLHVAGALKHHLVDRDDTLRRMLPGAVGAAAATAAPQPGHRGPALAAAGLWAGAIALGSVLGLAHAPDRPLAETAPATATAPAEAGSWTVEEGTLALSVTQLGAQVAGSFEDWTAHIAFDPEAASEVKGEVRVEIAIASLALGSVTGQALGTEFFAADAHPTAVFAGEIREAPDAAMPYVADGTLTLKGAEVPVALPFDLALEGDTARMTGAVTLDRRDFGIGTASYNDEKTVGFAVRVDVALTASRAE